MCVTPFVLINTKVSEEGHEFTFSAEGRQKVPSVKKMIKDKVKCNDSCDHSTCKDNVVSGTYKGKNN